MKRYCLGLIVVIALFFVAGAGCTAPAKTINTSGNTTTTQGALAASYVATLNQPDGQSGYLKMDTDIYNVGEVVEFTVTNEGSGTLKCAGDPPSFSIRFQTGGGAWATQTETGNRDDAQKTQLEPGKSTKAYRFVTAAMEPGRYRIVHDCGIEHEILIRALPAPVPTPVVCPVANTSGAKLWIDISPISNQVVSRPITIQGVTNIPAGQELKFTIVPSGSKELKVPYETGEYFTMTVQEGSCGTNTWSVNGEIQETGEFIIVISDTGGNVTALRRFSVLPS